MFCCCSVTTLCPALCDPTKYSMPGFPVPQVCCSVTTLCPTLCDPTKYSMPGFPVPQVCCSVTTLCPTLCDPTKYSMPGFPVPQVCSKSCPLNELCYLAISSSVTAFSFLFQSFPASGSFAVSCLFASGGQSIVVRVKWDNIGLDKKFIRVCHTLEKNPKELFRQPI